MEEDGDVLERTDTDFDLLRFLADGAMPGAMMMVLSAKGSTPAGAGAMMAVDRIGRIYGTVGGGCGEAEVISTARRIIGTGRSTVVEISLTNDVAEQEGMVCGGAMRVLVEDICGR